MGVLPNRIFDPQIGADLYNRYLDEYVIADELGLHHMVNEHHQTATCINSTVPLTAAIIARQTKRGRICVLGNPVANRGEPIRIAEEMAMIDCISRGRLDCGFVRGVPYENHAANSNPTKTVERLWEGVDLIVKAWTTHDGPFSYEGPITHRRAINIWPRPYQSPHPPIWITGSSDFDAIRKVASRGFTFATFLQPYGLVRQMFDAYRSGYRGSHLPNGGGMAFMPLVYTADNEAEAEAGAVELTWYLKAKVRRNSAIRRVMFRSHSTSRPCRAPMRGERRRCARPRWSTRRSRASSCTARRTRSPPRSGGSTSGSAASTTC